MNSSSGILAFISGQRELLDRLEQFTCTPDYQRLLAVVAPLDVGVGDMEQWLAEWLINRDFSHGELPIDLAGRPGGVELVELQLLRVFSGAYS